jgi:chemosensory pili system protein ChpB (putative protein-glutamate methylesterase)
LLIDLELALVYVQHKESQQSHILANSIARSSDYNSQMASHGEVLCVNTVA